MLERYFKYRRVIARFRRGALGNEIDQIAAELSTAGYKRNSVKLYVARIARFSVPVQLKPDTLRLQTMEPGGIRDEGQSSSEEVLD